MNAAAPDLFDTPLLPGLRLHEEAIDRATERALMAAIDGEALAPFRFQGWAGKRLTASFGWRYDFDDQSFTPGDPLPPWLLPVRAVAARLTGIAAEAMGHALLLRYDPGAGIGWHRDRPVFDQVIGLSLGAAATMRFRRRTARGFERQAVPLAPRALYHLTGPAREAWEHSIAPLPHTRWSITFRTLTDHER